MCTSAYRCSPPTFRLSRVNLICDATSQRGGVDVVDTAVAVDGAGVAACPVLEHADKRPATARRAINRVRTTVRSAPEVNRTPPTVGGARFVVPAATSPRGIPRR